MKLTKFSIFSAVIYLFILASISSALAKDDFTREQWGTGRYYGQIGDYKFDFRVIRVPYNEAVEKRNEIKKWLGEDSYNTPRFVATNVTIEIDGKSIKIPQNIITDLGNPSGAYGMSVEMKDANINFKLKGGDGAGSYTAVFVVANYELIERHIVEYIPSKDDYGIVETIKIKAP